MKPLAARSPFPFACRPGLECFTRCCRDVNIFLTPYDIRRLKTGLGLKSDEFLARHTLTLLPPNGFPLVLLKMREEPEKRCPFVGGDGCAVYADRPWACRLYPLDRGDGAGEYRTLVGPEQCRGLAVGPESPGTVADYFAGQELAPYEEAEAPFQRLTGDPRLAKARIEDRRLQEMIRLALYDLDRFREFVFETRFLETFLVDEELRARAKADEGALLELAYRWLEFGLLAGETLKIREDLLRPGQPAPPGAGDGPAGNA